MGSLTKTLWDFFCFLEVFLFFKTMNECWKVHFGGLPYWIITGRFAPGWPSCKTRFAMTNWKTTWLRCITFASLKKRHLCLPSQVPHRTDVAWRDCWRGWCDGLGLVACHGPFRQLWHVQRLWQKCHYCFSCDVTLARLLPKIFSNFGQTAMVVVVDILT